VLTQIKRIMTKIGDVEVRAIIKFCVGIEKTPTETYKMIQASSTTKKCCRSLVFRWHDMFRNGRESIEDDKRCGQSSVVSEFFRKSKHSCVVDALIPGWNYKLKPKE
jgi:hypothetical protein